MNVFQEIFDPAFLLRNSVYTSLLIGFICPLAGVFLVMRRLVFLGVALPQISSTGIALALSLHIWYGDVDLFHGTGEHTLAVVGSLVFSLATIFLLARIAGSRRGLMDGALGTAYVVAAASSVLLLSECPQAERHWLEIFKGEIIAITTGQLRGTALAFGIILALLVIFRREFLLVSFDREMAVTMGKAVGGWDFLLYLIIGVTIAVSVLGVGPLVTFGFMVIPPLIARNFARTVRQFMIGSSLIGGLTAVAGFAIALRRDLPVGATDVALLGAIYVLAFVVRRVPRLRRATATA